MIWGDYHIHTTYSGCNGHATCTPEVILQQAKQKGLKQVGLCDHGINHVFYGTNLNRIKRLKNKIEKLNSQQSDVKMLLGIESNIYSLDGEIDIDVIEKVPFDLVVAGFHKMVWCKSIKDGVELGFPQIFNVQSKDVERKFTRAVISVIKSKKIDILAHPAYGFPVDIGEIVKAAIDYDVALELNGKRIFLTDEQILLMAESKVKLVADSDAHDANRVGDVSLPLATCQRLGIPPTRLINYKNLLF